jgi:hypothetical protein
MKVGFVLGGIPCFALLGYVAVVIELSDEIRRAAIKDELMIIPLNI